MQVLLCNVEQLSHSALRMTGFRQWDKQFLYFICKYLAYFKLKYLPKEILFKYLHLVIPSLLISF